MFSASFRDAGAITYTPSNREIQEYLDYLRTHHFLRDEFLERRILAGGGRRRRRRRRRGRYAKMKKLTAEEVEKLFPKKLYAEWLALADDDDDTTDTTLLVHVAVVADQSSSSSHVAVPVTLPCDPCDDCDLAVVEIHEMHDLRPRPLHDIHEDAVSLAVLLAGKGGPHFDSGSCAICLEIFENEDVVRGLVCGHVFHAECVDPWLIRRRACCPICKRDYYKEESLDGTNGLREGEQNEGDAHSTNHGEQTEGANSEATPAEDTEGTPTEGAVAEASQTGTTPDGESPTNESSGQNANQNADENPDRVVLRTTNGTTYRLRDDDDSINYDALRTDPNLQALLQELIPLSQRVRVILDEHPELDLEARGREIASQKYKSIWRKVFWRLMGILKDDLFNWAVIQVYQSDQQNVNNGADDPDAPDASAEAVNGETVTSTRASYESAHAAADGAEQPTGSAEGVRLLSPTPSRSPSVYHNVSDMEGVDVSEAVRRDTVERQV